MHAHLRRRIDTFGIDTSHFTRRPSQPPRHSRRRLASAEVLVFRDRQRRRAHPDLLRRALAERGVPTRCSACGTGQHWNGKPLTLQVDHINGDFSDCRPENVRLLCPNCHSQTPTYAGRNRRTFGVPAGQSSPEPVRQPSVESSCTQPLSEERLIEAMAMVDRHELTATRAAELVGCHRNHWYRLRRRLEETGSLRPRSAGRQWRSAAHRDTVIAYALAHPDLGPKAIAQRLRELQSGGCTVSHGTVSNILRAAGLNTVAKRRSRLVEPAGVV